MFALMFAALWSVFVLPAHAAGEVETIIAGVENAYKEVQTLKADFVQVTRSKAMGTETKQRGKVRLKRPKKMRWLFTQPGGQEFVTNGETMWVWSAADNQVIVSSGVGGASSGMAQLLDDLDRLSEIFDVELLPAEGRPNTVLLGLKPRQEASFQSLKLRLMKKTFMVSEVLMIDAFGNEVELAFNMVKTNAPLEDSEFVFKVPDGAQVLNTDGP